MHRWKEQSGVGRWWGQHDAGPWFLRSPPSEPPLEVGRDERNHLLGSAQSLAL